jgi:MFS family permease
VNSPIITNARYLGWLEEMESLGSPSSIARKIRERIHRFFFMELSSSPSAIPDNLGMKVFCAHRFWKSNVCGAVVGGIAGAVLFVIVGGLLLCQSHGWRGWLWGSGLILYAVVMTLALFWGNLAALYPYALEIDEGKGFRFYVPFKKLYVPTGEVKRVKWSWFVLGWVVKLRHRRGLLPCFIIHVAWGQQGRDLAKAIEQELALRA